MSTSPLIALDHPRVRASLHCPFCDQPKDSGALACWPCWHAFADDAALDHAFGAMLDAREAALAARRVVATSPYLNRPLRSLAQARAALGRKS